MTNENTTFTKLENVRLAFPALWDAQSFRGSKPKFSATFLIPETAEQTLAAVRAATQAAATKKWDSRATTVLSELAKTNKLALHSGADKEQYVGFAGHWYINASNVMRPTVLDVDNALLVEADGKPYAGCYVDALIELWAQDNAFGRRINASLAGVKFVRDGEPFVGGRVAGRSDFGGDSEVLNALL